VPLTEPATVIFVPVPEQMLPVPPRTRLVTGRGLTVIVMASDIAGLFVTHVRLEVILTLMTSPLTRSDAEYVDPVAPGISTPPFVHW
jgi:hypothetical protein